MKRLNPEYIEAVKRKVNECPYFSLLSMELKEVGMGDCRLELEVQEKHLQLFLILVAMKFSMPQRT